MDRDLFEKVVLVLLSMEGGRVSSGSTEYEKLFADAAEITAKIEEFVSKNLCD